MSFISLLDRGKCSIHDLLLRLLPDYTGQTTLIGHVMSPRKLGDVDLLVLALGGVSGDFDLLMKVDRRHCGLIQ